MGCTITTFCRSPTTPGANLVGLSSEGVDPSRLTARPLGPAIGSQQRTPYEAARSQQTALRRRGRAARRGVGPRGAADAAALQVVIERAGCRRQCRVAMGRGVLADLLAHTEELRHQALPGPPQDAPKGRAGPRSRRAPPPATGPRARPAATRRAARSRAAARRARRGARPGDDSAPSSRLQLRPRRHRRDRPRSGPAGCPRRSGRLPPRQLRPPWPKHRRSRTAGRRPTAAPTPAGPSGPRCSPRSRTAGRPVAADDRHAPVPAERPARQPGAHRRLAALVLGGVDHPAHPLHDLRRRDLGILDLGHGPQVLHIEPQDGVQTS